MIVKDLEAQQHSDPLRRAGYEAEKQMAHYLKRAFGEHPARLVFHNLRLDRRGEVAQLDHLILHRFGVVVIESKSVAGQVSVNEQGEWTRWWNRQGRGMPSPVLQARRQLDLLAQLLADHNDELMDRALFGLKQRYLGGLRRDVLVAVSDGGRITRKRDVPEVVKADQVPERVTGIIESSGRFGAFAFTDAELMRLSAFLRTRHQPLALPVQEPSASPQPVPPAAPAVRVSEERKAQVRPDGTPRCRTCASMQLSVQYGRYGYYLKCADCDGNTPARPICEVCAQPARLSKKGLEFTATCPDGHTWRYWVNPAE